MNDLSGSSRDSLRARIEAAERRNAERSLADHLHGIRVHESAVFMRYRHDLTHGLNHAGLVVRP